MLYKYFIFYSRLKCKKTFGPPFRIDEYAYSAHKRRHHNFKIKWNVNAKLIAESIISWKLL